MFLSMEVIYSEDAWREKEMTLSKSRQVVVMHPKKRRARIPYDVHRDAHNKIEMKQTFQI